MNHRIVKRSSIDDQASAEYRPFGEFYAFPKEKRGKKRPQATPKTSDDEQLELANDDFFFKQIRRGKQLLDHPLKDDVEVFDVESMQKFGESAEEKSKPINETTKKQVNFEFIQEPKQLDKNSKYLSWEGDIETLPKRQKTTCHECAGQLGKSYLRFDEKKVINDFKSRILGRDRRE